MLNVMWESSFKLRDKGNKQTKNVRKDHLLHVHEYL